MSRDATSTCSRVRFRSVDYGYVRYQVEYKTLRKETEGESYDQDGYIRGKACALAQGLSGVQPISSSQVMLIGQ
jgi:hypothetical protein